jgi:hypothetical protein
MSKSKQPKSNIKNAEPNTNFDLDKFNKEFVFKKELATVQNRITSKEKIDRLTKAANTEIKSLYNLSVAELVVGIKDTWFGILDDVLAQKIEFKTLTKDNRLFFIGLTIIFITTIIYLYNFFLDEEDTLINDKKETIIEKHYIYKDNAN